MGFFDKVFVKNLQNACFWDLLIMIDDFFVFDDMMKGFPGFAKAQTIEDIEFGERSCLNGIKIINDFPEHSCFFQLFKSLSSRYFVLPNKNFIYEFNFQALSIG